MQRPVGVTILAILSFIAGVWGLLGGLVLLGFGGAIAGVTAMRHPGMGAVIGGLAVVLAGITLATGALSLVFAIGAWSLKPWAWTLGIVTHGIILLASLGAAMGPGIGATRWGRIIISAVVLFYLFRPEIRRAFGRE
jgi:uncharacterized membrane protein (DUF2068 family)